MGDRHHVYLGVDPGASGGLALISKTGEVLHYTSMPKTERDLWLWIIGMTDKFLSFQIRAVIEKVGGYLSGQGEGSGGGAANGSAMFKFGMSYGGLRMALIAAHIPFREVTPQTWQKKVGVIGRGKGETKTTFKNRLKAMAQQIFPNEHITLATCDALLLAEYLRREEVQ